MFEANRAGLKLELTVVLDGVFRNEILPERVFVLSVLEPHVRMFVNDQITQIIVVEYVPGDVVRNVWGWISGKQTATVNSAISEEFSIHRLLQIPNFQCARCCKAIRTQNARSCTRDS